MILVRPGNKSRLAESIYKTFPKHHVYLEPFFGAGGLYFNKPQAMHNIVNDIDDDVFNLWSVYTKQYDKLLEAIQDMPKSESLFNYWKKNPETDPVMRALRFLFLSNFSYMGKSDCFNIAANNSKNVLLQRFYSIKNMMLETTVCNSDYRIFFKNLKYSSFYEINNFTVLSYNDPPYLGTADNYSHSFTEQDSIDLFDINCNLSSKYPNKYYFAVSEFNHPFILEQAKERNLNIINLGERQTMKNRNTEILITNYETELGLFDSLGGACNSKSPPAFV